MPSPLQAVLIYFILRKNISAGGGLLGLLLPALLAACLPLSLSTAAAAYSALPSPCLAASPKA